MEDRRHESADGIPRRWAEMPPPPSDFPEKATFDLTPEEARFLCACIDLKHPHTYLAHILRQGHASSIWDADFPWEHISARGAPSALSAWLRDAKLFSLVHQGAAILYNVMLAEGLQHDEGRSAYTAILSEWIESIRGSQSELDTWDRTSMWQRLRSVNPRLRARTIEFVDLWHALVMARPPLGPAVNAEARRLVRERERTLKGTRARLTYAEARDNRRGYPASGRLEFRWSQVKRIVADILGPLEGY